MNIKWIVGALILGTTATLANVTLDFSYDTTSYPSRLGGPESPLTFVFSVNGSGDVSLDASATDSDIDVQAVVNSWDGSAGTVSDSALWGTSFTLQLTGYSLSNGVKNLRLEPDQTGGMGVSGGNSGRIDGVGEGRDPEYVEITLTSGDVMLNLDQIMHVGASEDSDFYVADGTLSNAFYNVGTAGANSISGLSITNGGTLTIAQPADSDQYDYGIAFGGLTFSVSDNSPAEVASGNVIALKAPNGLYVTANNNSDYWGTIPYTDLALAATYNKPGDGYAKFIIEDLGDGIVALKCLENNKYISVSTGTKQLTADRNLISGNRQKFTIVTNSPTEIGLMSAYNSMYVTAPAGSTTSLRATESSMGADETFVREVLADAPAPPFNLVGDIAANLMPEPIGTAVAENLLDREHYWTVAGPLHYAEYYTANGALRFARVTENTSLLNSVFDRYNTPSWPYRDGSYTVTSMTNDATLFMGTESPSDVTTKRTSFILVEWYLSTGDLAYHEKAEERWASRGGGPTSNPNADGMFSTPTLEKIFYELPALTPAEKTVCIDNMSRFLSGYTTPVMQKDNGLYMHHPTDNNPADPLSFEVWGRGAGWCNMALAEGLTMLPETDPQWDNTYRSYLKFMDGLLGYQHASGMWYQIMDRPGESSPGGYANWLESSGTAMACYAMVRGVKEGWLDANVYGPIIRNAWYALATRVDGNGALEDVCRGMSEARLGEGLDYYMYEDDRNRTGDFHGQAPLLWLASELIENDFNTWAMDYGLLGTEAFLSANTDGDAQSNFEEYIFGGNPTNPSHQGWPITYAIQRSGGTNWVEYTHPRRTGTSSGLAYILQGTDDLIDGTWSNVSNAEQDVSALDDNYEEVTNRISIGTKTNQYFRLKVERD